jgi:hypothetical protein
VLSRSGDLIVTGRDASLLLRSLRKPGLDIDDAVAAGLVVKEKIEGRWLFHLDGASIEAARSSLAREASQIVSSWFIVPMPWLPAMAAKRVRALTKDSAEVLLHQLVREQAFAGIGLLTQRDQPYLALHLPDDGPAVDERARAMEDAISRRGHVTFRELPDPPRPTDNEGWRASLLQHGEFLGLGIYGNWELRGWSAV